jgi:hypothetical protein
MNHAFDKRQGRLPSLAARLGPFAGFGPGRGKQEQIHAILAPLARRDRSSRPKRYYTVREVGAYFGVSLRTAGMVYRHMEQEGVIARIRGPGTVLTARKGGTHVRVPVRGVVAVLNWLPGFLHISDQRYFMMELERALWEKNFASSLVFYHEEEKREPAFANRILAHRPDFAIWLTPGTIDSLTMNVLSDAGVRMIAIADKPVPTRTPKYVISWRRGMEAALRAWRRQGVRRVVIPTEPQGINPLLPQLDPLLRSLGMEFALCPIGNESMEDYVARLAAQPAGVVFAYDIWHAKVCAQAPRAFTRLLAKQRVLNCWSLPIEVGILGEVRTDAIVMPWSRIVDRIAEDLNSGAIFSRTADLVFEAAWTPRARAAQLSRLYDFETT